MPNYEKGHKKKTWGQIRREAYEKAKGLCTYCGKKVPWEEYDAHHRMPRWLGGTDNVRNTDVYHRKCHQEHHKKEKKERRKLWGASLEDKI